MTQNFLDNTLYEMDNLIVLRGMNSETVDLIATDPPFNTKRNRSGSAGEYEDKWTWLKKETKKRPDQWKWNEIHPKWLEEIEDNHKALYHAIDAAIHCQGQDTAAFLCFLSVRLLEMHRILKPTGSIYLHCDPTASHYIKTCMDAIFGKQNFRTEITWKRATSTQKGSQHASKRWGNNADIIYYYAKSKESSLSPERELTESEILEKFKHIDENGERYYDDSAHIWCSPNMGKRPNLCYKWKGFVNPHPSGWRLSKERLEEEYQKGNIVIRQDGKLERRKYLKDYKGASYGNIWDDIRPASGRERTGSPDQKPLALYERIIKASSNEGDLVLDPFCGCATTIIAANNLKRRWIGIDRRTDARYHIITRLMGIDRKERERLAKYATDKAWLDKQEGRYEMHYQTEPPKRTDNGKQTTPELKQVYSAEPTNLLSHDEMKEILINQFGVECWGCGFEPPDKDDRYLHLDHINPKSSGGSNDIDNRSILCQPCNSKKLNTMTLDGLRKKNEKEKHMKKSKSQLIDIPSAVQWTRNHMVDLIRSTPHQYEIF